LKDFEEHIWHQPIPKDSLDSIAQANANGKEKTKAKKSSSRRSKASSAATNKAPKASGGSSSPRVSARRQRR